MPFQNENDDAEEVLSEEAADKFDQLQSSMGAVKKPDLVEISYQQGLVHMAAAIASHFRDDKSLGTTEMKSKIPASMFSNAINKGGLITPTDEWLSDVTKMDEMFEHHHPKDQLVKGVGLVGDFSKKLHDAFPNRKTALLDYFCRARTRARIRHMNRKIMEPKRGTLRGRRKLVEWAF